MTEHPATHYYEQIVASLTSGVIAAGPDGAVITSNPAASRHLGVPPHCIASGAKLGDWPELAPIASVFDQVRRTHTPISRHELTVGEPDGAHKVIGLSASLMQGPDDFNGVILLFIDMTKTRDLEHAADLNRQLAQIGELTAGVVHELRNPLGVISGMAELVLRKLEPGDDRREAVQLIVEEAESLERAIAQFLGFAKPFELRPAPCRPEDIVQRAIRLAARRALDKKVSLEGRTPGELPRIEADADKAAQALANLVNNAIDAVHEAGEVVVSARAADGVVVFEVNDNGPGVHLDPGEDLFKPFFSLKDSGTGLGLAIVQRIVNAHHGHVSYHNRAGGGACFEIQLPVELPAGARRR